MCKRNCGRPRGRVVTVIRMSLLIGMWVLFFYLVECARTQTNAGYFRRLSLEQNSKFNIGNSVYNKTQDTKGVVVGKWYVNDNGYEGIQYQIRQKYRSYYYFEFELEKVE